VEVEGGGKGLKESFSLRCSQIVLFPSCQFRGCRVNGSRCFLIALFYG